MQVENNFSLQSFNTFGLPCETEHYALVKNRTDLEQLFASEYWEKKRFVLGGGSNILLPNRFNGLTVHIANKGIDIIDENKYKIDVKVGAGEEWHNFVLHCLSEDWGGLENLSLIPGSVGAAPMQNIGAYGVEQNSCFRSLTAFDVETGRWQIFDNDDCQFGYRESVFKNELKNKYIIFDVTYRLSKKSHKINKSYGAIIDQLNKNEVGEANIQDISKAVIEIRQSKLPDPKVIGNSGSFFKNPIISKREFETLVTQYPHIPSYEVDEDHTKVPAGWLIEQCGWKGKQVGQTGTHSKQALVIVNHGGASGEEILELSKKIIESVEEKFDITLQAEVNIIK